MEEAAASPQPSWFDLAVSLGDKVGLNEHDFNKFITAAKDDMEGGDDADKNATALAMVRQFIEREKKRDGPHEKPLCFLLAGEDETLYTLSDMLSDRFGLSQRCGWKIANWLYYACRCHRVGKKMLNASDFIDQHVQDAATLVLDCTTKTIPDIFPTCLKIPLKCTKTWFFATFQADANRIIWRGWKNARNMTMCESSKTHMHLSKNATRAIHIGIQSVIADEQPMVVFVLALPPDIQDLGFEPGIDFDYEPKWGAVIISRACADFIMENCVQMLIRDVSDFYKC